MPTRSFKKRAGGAFLLSGLICCLAACDKPTPISTQQTPPVVIQPTLSSIQANIFALKCAVAGCHVTGGIAPMSLESANAFATLVNAPSNYGTPALLRVKPNDAANSALYLKIIGDPQTGGAQARMPLGIGPMSSAEVNAIQMWINTGAANN
jgi:hypothetical protein